MWNDTKQEEWRSLVSCYPWWQPEVTFAYILSFLICSNTKQYFGNKTLIWTCYSRLCFFVCCFVLVVTFLLTIGLKGLTNRTPVMALNVQYSPSSSLDFGDSWSKTACTIGIIMAVVAVLLIHIDKNAVTLMNPSINLCE